MSCVCESGCGRDGAGALRKLMGHFIVFLLAGARWQVRVYSYFIVKNILRVACIYTYKHFESFFGYPILYVVTRVQDRYRHIPGFTFVNNGLSDNENNS